MQVGIFLIYVFGLFSFVSGNRIWKRRYRIYQSNSEHSEFINELNFKLRFAVIESFEHIFLDNLGKA
jgi:hypothetical protein